MIPATDHRTTALEPLERRLLRSGNIEAANRFGHPEWLTVVNVEHRLPQSLAAGLE